MAVVVEHLERCASCRQEAEGYHRLNRYLRMPQEDTQVSRGFETVFWSKVSRRQSSPWLERLLTGLEALVPMPNLRQAVTFAVLAFFIGNVGGIASNFRQESLTPTPMASMRYFSGIQEFKGIAPYSMAGAYLSAAEKEVS